MGDRPLFSGMDEQEQEQAEQVDERDVADAGPVVGGMGTYPGSGATGLGGTAMAPPVTAGAAEDAVEDVTEEGDADEHVDAPGR